MLASGRCPYTHIVLLNVRRGAGLQAAGAGSRKRLEDSPMAGTVQTVLLADDEDLVRGFVRTVLERSGYCVLEAPGGDEALELCEQYEGPIDLLVTDVVMPRMNGRELAERVRDMRPGTKVLYV